VDLLGFALLRLIVSSAGKARTSQAMPFSTTRPKSPGWRGASRPKRRTSARASTGVLRPLGLLGHRLRHHRQPPRVVAVDHHRRRLPKMRALAAA
jgi:hypothetical protein